MKFSATGRKVDEAPVGISQKISDAYAVEIFAQLSYVAMQWFQRLASSASRFHPGSRIQSILSYFKSVSQSAIKKTKTMSFRFFMNC